MARIAVILFNLGGPDNLAAVKPFLRNLFNDPAIITAPTKIRRILSWYIATRRTRHSQEIYKKIGGSSPIRLQTEKQARALEDALSDLGEVRAFPCMRYWYPLSDQVAKAVAEYRPDQVILLPLYPQFSTTTSGSSITEWRRAAEEAGITAKTRTVCCYADDEAFIAAEVALIKPMLQAAQAIGPTRLLLSAHGLPKKIIDKGDPYQWQVEQTCAAVAHGLAGQGFAELDWQVCYQSRVGPMQWIGPATDDAITRAGQDGRAVVLAPIAFVSEHSETLVELDMDYRDLAANCGVSHYARVPTVGTNQVFIDGLSSIVRKAIAWPDSNNRCGGANMQRYCPNGWTGCGHGSSSHSRAS
jgi:ferrochelatase